MFGVIKNSWALFLGMSLLMFGNSLQGSLLGVRGAIEGFDPSLMGYVMSAYFVGFLGGSLLAPDLIRRVGYVRVFAALGSLISAAFVIYAVFVNIWAWALMRFVVGFCFSGVYVVAESWLNNSATNETRGQTLSAYSIVQMIGIVGGQMLLNISDPAGFELFVLMSVIVSISFAPILLSAAPAPMADNAERFSFVELYHASPLGVIGMVILGGIFSAMFGMSAVYAGEIGLSVDEVAIFVSLLYAPALLAQYPIGWLSDRIDRRRLVVICTFFAALGCLFGIIGSESRLAIYAAAIVLGATIHPLYSLLIAHTNDYLPASKMAAASSGLVFLNGVGAASGPIFVGYMMGVFGPPGFFLFICVLSAAICVYGLYRSTQRAAPEPEESGDYANLLPRGAIAAEMAAEVYADEDDTSEDTEKDVGKDTAG